MEKIYTKKFLFTLCFLMMIFSLGFGQMNLLYVGGDATAAAGDAVVIDSLESWGWTVTYTGTSDYSTAANVYDGIDGAVFSESVGSTSVCRFGPNPDKNGSDFQDNFPVPWILLESAVLQASESRWDLLSETGGTAIHLNEAWSAEDLTMKIVDNTHYITSDLGFEINDLVTWSTGTPAGVPYMHGLKYDFTGLAEPHPDVPLNYTEGPVYVMLIMEDFNFEHKMFFFGLSASLLESMTADWYKILKRAAKYTFEAWPAAIEDKMARIAKNYDLVAFPNPASVEATIRFYVSQPVDATVALIDMTGKQIATVYNQRTVAGNNIIFLNADDYAPGVYFVKLQIGNNTAYTKILLQ